MALQILLTFAKSIRLKIFIFFRLYFKSSLQNFKILFLINVIFFSQIRGQKKKHKKRRLVNYFFLKKLISHCSLNGSIYFSSDNIDYFENVQNYAKILKKKGVKISFKLYKKTPTIITKYHNRALKLRNNVNFLKIDKI